MNRIENIAPRVQVDSNQRFFFFSAILSLEGLSIYNLVRLICQFIETNSTQKLTMNRLQGKACVVTGSSSGLGRAIALAYSREGANVVCADLTSAARKDVAAETATATNEMIVQEGRKAIFVQTDVTRASAWQNLVERTVAEFGRIDV